MNGQFRKWLDTVANVRVHGPTQRVIGPPFSEEHGLTGVARGPVRRRYSEGLVSVGGNDYSVPDRTHQRILDVHSLAHAIRLYEQAERLAVHPLLEGRRHTALLPEHRRALRHRPLTFYDQLAQRLAEVGRGA